MAKKAAPKVVDDKGTTFTETAAVYADGKGPREQDATAAAISKAEAIRRALAAGYEGPQEGTAYILKEFGIEVAPQHFSAAKSQLKKREETRRAEGMQSRKPKAASSQGVEGYLAPPEKRQAVGEGDLLAAMEAMKPLVASLGADKVKRIVDLLG